MANKPNTKAEPINNADAGSGVAAGVAPAPPYKAKPMLSFVVLNTTLVISVPVTVKNGTVPVY